MSLAQAIADSKNTNRRSIEVSDWQIGGASVVLYCGAITAGDIDKLQRKHKDFLNNMTMAGMVDLIILKAETKDGEKAFTLEDKPILMRESVSVIADLAGQMFSDVTSVEDYEKN